MTGAERLEALEAAVVELAGRAQGTVATDEQFGHRFPALAPFARIHREREVTAREARPAKPKLSADRYKPVFASWHP
jgi:hypothetical protein